MNFSELKKCPHCESEEFIVVQWAEGPVKDYKRFDGGEADNTERYSELLFRGTRKAYCSKCGKYLGKPDTDEVSPEVVSKLSEENIHIPTDEESAQRWRWYFGDEENTRSE